MSDRSMLLAPGWTVTVRLGPGWTLERRDNSVTARKTDVEDLWIGSIAKVASYSLWEVAEAAMRRHVGQGEPDRFPAIVSGRPAFGYEWSDGAQTVVTWWLELDAEWYARVEYTIGTMGCIREQADAMLAAVEITPD
jgi:hypothetical protein